MLTRIHLQEVGDAGIDGLRGDHGMKSLVVGHEFSGDLLPGAGYMLGSFGTPVEADGADVW